MEQVSAQFHYSWWQRYFSGYILFFIAGLATFLIIPHQQQGELFFIILWVAPISRGLYMVWFGMRKVPSEGTLLAEGIRFTFVFGRTKFVSYSDITEMEKAKYWDPPNVKLNFTDGSTLLLLAQKGSEDFDLFLEELRKRNSRLSNF
jgi:hypothetical protein